MHGTLKGKISLVYLSLVLLIALVGSAAFISLFNLGKAIEGLMIANYKSINAASNMMEAIERQDSAVLIYINVDSKKGKDMFAGYTEEFYKWFNIEANNLTEVGEKELVKNIKNSYKGYIKVFLDLQEVKNGNNVDKAIELYNTKIMPDFTQIKKYLLDLSQLNEKAMFRGKDAATRNSKSFMYMILTLSILAIIGGFITSRFSTNKFLAPISILTQNMKRVKIGDLDQQANIDTKDEIGELAQEFNNMTMRLKQYEQSTLGMILGEKTKFLAIMNSISEPLIVLDNDYRVALLNPSFEKTFNVKEADLIKRHFLEGIRNGEIFDFISDACKSIEAPHQKIFTIKTENEDKYFNAIITPIKDNEAFSGLIVIFQNVTQLKELERIRTDFIATISHEFKTPLTSIIMGTDVLLEEGMGKLNNEQKQFIEAIREDSDRLTNLVGDLLELTRIESGRAIFKFQKHSIEDIIDFATKPFYQKAEQNEINLYYQCDDNLPDVIADFEKITWVLNNLISNALKYTGAGDEICIKASACKDKVLVKVSDTGVGIPNEYLSKIFEKFVQVKDGDFEVRGTGLGLAVVKEIIEAHGGEIWCESKLDVGSSFMFTLAMEGKE